MAETDSKRNLLSFAKIVFGITIAFLLGAATATHYPALKKKIAASLFSREKADAMLQNWDAQKLSFYGEENSGRFFAQGGKTVVFFWATWCPWCKKVLDVAENLGRNGISVVGVPFDKDEDYFRYFLENRKIGWKNLVQKEGGNFSFVARSGSFDIPLIPSWWIVSDGKVEKIFSGSASAKDLQAYLGIADKNDSE